MSQLQNESSPNQSKARSNFGWFLSALFVICLLLVGVFLIQALRSTEKKLIEQNASFENELFTHCILLQLVIAQEEYFQREGRWNPHAAIMYRCGDLDTTHYRYTVDTAKFIIRAELRDYQSTMEVQQYIAVNRHGQFLKDARPGI